VHINIHHIVRFTVLMAASMKMAVFWVVVPWCLLPSSGWWLIALMMEAASTSETMVNFYQTT
jgi:hypothetical protein